MSVGSPTSSCPRQPLWDGVLDITFEEFSQGDHSADTSVFVFGPLFGLVCGDNASLCDLPSRNHLCPGNWLLWTQRAAGKADKLPSACGPWLSLLQGSGLRGALYRRNVGNKKEVKPLERRSFRADLGKPRSSEAGGKAASNPRIGALA